VSIGLISSLVGSNADRHAHNAFDEAVAESYGWGDDWRDGKLTNDEILARLFKLNQERAKAESKAAAQVKVKGKKNGK
jgi:hypothetical protein